MKRFVEGENRSQGILCPERLDDCIAEDNPLRAIGAFVDGFDLCTLGFEGCGPRRRAVLLLPPRHPFEDPPRRGYLNRIQSSHRLERETQRNVERLWPTGKLMPGFKTIADFRRDSGPAIRRVCREFIELCRGLGHFAEAIGARDGSKLQAVNNRDKNPTDRKRKARLEQPEESIARCLP